MLPEGSLVVARAGLLLLDLAERLKAIDDQAAVVPVGVLDVDLLPHGRGHTEGQFHAETGSHPDGEIGGLHGVAPGHLQLAKLETPERPQLLVAVAGHGQELVGVGQLLLEKLDSVRADVCEG